MKSFEQIKQLRKSSGYTLEQLAQRCGLTKGYLSRVENGRQTPAVSTIQKIASALNADITDLLGEPSSDQMVDGLEIRHSAGEAGRDTSDGYSFVPLTGQYGNKQMAPFLMIIEKGATKKFSHDSEEFFYVLDGEVELFYKGKSYVFSRGDSCYFDSREKHCFKNNGDEPVRLLTVNYNYRRF